MAFWKMLQGQLRPFRGNPPGARRSTSPSPLHVQYQKHRRYSSTAACPAMTTPDDVSRSSQQATARRRRSSDPGAPRSTCRPRAASPAAASSRRFAAAVQLRHDVDGAGISSYAGSTCARTVPANIPYAPTRERAVASRAARSSATPAASQRAGHRDRTRPDGLVGGACSAACSRPAAPAAAGQGVGPATAATPHSPARPGGPLARMFSFGRLPRQHRSRPRPRAQGRDRAVETEGKGQDRREEADQASRCTVRRDPPEERTLQAADRTGPGIEPGRDQRRAAERFRPAPSTTAFGASR